MTAHDHVEFVWIGAQSWQASLEHANTHPVHTVHWFGGV